MSMGYAFAIAESSSSDFDWNSIFEDAHWFHFSGITPALGKNTVAACMEACKAAKQKESAADRQNDDISVPVDTAECCSVSEISI